MDKCQWCENELRRSWKSYRYGALFCSDGCRTKYHNAKKRIVRHAQNITLALADIEKLIIKGGELGELALATIRSVQVSAKVSSTYQCYCKNCGQNRLFFPLHGDKCDFCKQENWGFKEKEESEGLHESES